MKTFDKYYILNLHGNSLKKETAPDGSKDENVFDIRQGVAICLMIKQAGQTGCKVHYHDLYGLRDNKYDWLERKEILPFTFEAITPKSPYYFFITRETEPIQNYLTWKKITEILPVICDRNRYSKR